jgi:peptidoglycan/LPS O-acetylase OafA/YrhL
MSSHHTRISAREHLPVLDGVRAIAVMIVIVFHYWQRFTYGPYTLVGKLAVWGQTGVDLFFVLSGFLITGILLDSKGSKHFLRNFYVRRILRIFPLYYLTLLAVYVISPLLHLSNWTPWKNSVWFFVYLQNIPMTFAPALVSGPGHFWSLAVEEHYYLVWPFLIMLLDTKALLKVIASAIVVSVVTRIVFIHAVTFYFTLARLDGLAIGSALAIFALQPGGLSRFVAWARAVLCILGLSLVGAQLLLSGRGLLAIQVVKSTLIAVVYACVMILAIENKFGKLAGRLLSGSVLGSVGKYSYGMYVFHPFILVWLHSMGLPYSFPALLMSLCLTYVAAWASWMLFEKRFLALKRYFEYIPAAPGPPVPVTEASAA